jgi:HemY protein
MRAPSDPAWTADGIVTDRWMPVSPVSGRLDAFQWKVPLAEIAAEREKIDSDVIESTDLSAPLPPRSGGEGSGVGGVAASEVKPKSAAPASELPAPLNSPATAQQIKQQDSKEPGARPPTALPSPPPAPRAEAVIPLLHVPDDPGPDPSPDTDPEPGSAGVPRGLRLF